MEPERKPLGAALAVMRFGNHPYDASSLSFSLAENLNRKALGVAGGRALTNAADEPVTMVGVTMDVTDRHKAAIALMQSEKLAAVGRLAFSIAHEINNPLESVTNPLYLARGIAGRNDAVEMLKDWPEKARQLVAAADGESFFAVGMYTSVPGELNSPTNVTLLGDAMHAMTPTLDRGANLAMRDAALLGRQLQAVAAGEKPLAEALGTYEEELVRYGFKVMRESVAMGQQRMNQNPLP